jgi:hypothetical protein
MTAMYRQYVNLIDINHQLSRLVNMEDTNLEQARHQTGDASRPRAPSQLRLGVRLRQVRACLGAVPQQRIVCRTYPE